MPEWTWARSKEFITELQEAPKPPVVVPIVPYPEEEGVHEGSRYYGTAVSLSTIHGLLGYLQFLADCKDAILNGRRNPEIQNLALSITEGKPSSYEKAAAIHRWVYSNVGYQRTDKIVPPWELIKPGTRGDCKSFTALVGSLLGVAEIPCWLKLAKIGNVVDLHVYDLASLTWGVVDAVGAWFGREISPVSGYVIYEVDRTATWPPRVLPSGAELWVPEQLKKVALPLIAIIGGTIGTLALIAWVSK